MLPMLCPNISRFKLKLDFNKATYYVAVEEQGYGGELVLYRGSKNIALIVYKNTARDLQLSNMWKICSGSVALQESYLIFEWCGDFSKLLACTEKSRDK